MIIVNKIKLLSSIVAIIILTVACGGNRATRVILAPDFVPQEMIAAELAFVVLQEEPQIIYRGNIRQATAGSDALRNIHAGASDETVLWRHFENRMIAMATRELEISEAFFGQTDMNFRITKAEVRTLDEVVSVEIPDVNTHFEVYGGGTTNDPALVLLIDAIRIGTETNRYFEDRAELGFTTTSGRRLICLLSFTLWNNRENKLMSYGRVQSTVPITQDEATLENWDELYRNMIRQIFEGTGLVRRRR